MFFKKIFMKMISLNFRNYEYIGLLSLIVGLIIVILFFEYFFIEENFVYAMKKTKLISNELFLKGQHTAYNYVKKVDFNSFYFNDLLRIRKNLNLTFFNLSNNSIAPFSNLDISNYKLSFSTFRNNRVLNEISFDIKVRFTMTLDYLKNHIYYIDNEFVKLHLLPILEKSEFYGNLCESFQIGLAKHGWLMVYDQLTNKYLIGICTHSPMFNSCQDIGCGLFRIYYLFNK